MITLCIPQDVRRQLEDCPVISDDVTLLQVDVSCSGVLKRLRSPNELSLPLVAGVPT